MKIYKKYIIILTLIILTWIIFICFLKVTKLSTIDIKTIKIYIQSEEKYGMLIFILAWSMRIFIFIPGTTFMILGGMCFGLENGFLLSMLGIIINESIIYLESTNLIESRLKSFINKRYPKLNIIMKKHDYKVLALGIICPIVSTDVLCFVFASTGIRYSKYILTVIIASVPVILVYSFIGTRLVLYYM